MPIYEFYCRDCHAIFSFLARRPDTSKRPACPRCSRPDLDRQMSRFAISKGRSESDDEEPSLPDLDEERMERALMEMASEAENLDEENPRQAAQMMRKLYGAAGLPLGPGMEEAIRRMEAGEDPEKIEEEMGDVLEQEDPLMGGAGAGGLKSAARKLKPPEVDETLYDL